MVCDRCKMVVKTELEKLGFNPISVTLGTVEIETDQLSEIQMQAIALNLQQFGFELLTNRKKQMTAEVKALLIHLVHYSTAPLQQKLSDYLSTKLAVPYPTLSSNFSEMEGQTIEKYFIQQKMEKVKELLTYGEMSLSEIAYLLNFSSVAHLSAQFKKIIGKTPSAFKLQQNHNRLTLDKI